VYRVILNLISADLILFDFI
ncbi:hypothetical protein JL09_g6856, partial [Pichia kudriavzevii]